MEHSIEPILVERKCGGWLATTPTGPWPRIGVTADTAELARAMFKISMSKWLSSLADETRPAANGG